MLQLQSELPPFGLSLIAPILLLLLWRFPGYRLIFSLAIGFLWALWMANGALPGHALSLIEGEEIVVEGWSTRCLKIMAGVFDSVSRSNRY
ncbi:MAG: hypothetical protein ABW153_08305 [Sedimenticola sp.]